MLIHKKQVLFNQRSDYLTGEKTKSSFAPKQKILKTTWYFIGIPVYSVSEIISSTH